MNLCQRNNNPGNLRFRSQVGAKNSRGWAEWPTPFEGWRALVKQIKLDQARGDTFDKFVKEYAPSNENDTPKYLWFVCDGLRVKPMDQLSMIAPYAIAGMIAQIEGYFAEDNTHASWNI